MLSKWTYYQFTAIIFLGLLLFFTDQLSGELAISSGTETVNGTSLLTAGFIAAIVGWVYVMVYLQSKKKPALLNHAVWSKMPALLFIIGFLSIVAFLTLGTFGPLLEWTENARWLMYVFMVYFIFLFYLFVVSVILKNSKLKKHALHRSLYVTGGLLIIVIFML
ncbi:hypothetical protein ACFQ3N_01060 [Virgibacillus byunsanensis]|uniref:Cytochrome C assembly protein n=1 Tax=Virgibacillus byunsanensis TaxID=570945 RepID=A0ABW3LG67_9BACI